MSDKQKLGLTNPAGMARLHHSFAEGWRAGWPIVLAGQHYRWNMGVSEGYAKCAKGEATDRACVSFDAMVVQCMRHGSYGYVPKP